MKTKKILSIVVAFTFVGMLSMSCNKYDKMSILGSWEIDIKEAKGLEVDSCKEVLYFDSGSKQQFKQTYMLRNKNLTSWIIEGNYERKNNKITFSNQKRNDGEKVAPHEARTTRSAGRASGFCCGFPA